MNVTLVLTKQSSKHFYMYLILYINYSVDTRFLIK